MCRTLVPVLYDMPYLSYWRESCPRRRLSGSLPLMLISEVYFDRHLSDRSQNEKPSPVGAHSVQTDRLREQWKKNWKYILKTFWVNYRKYSKYSFKSLWKKRLSFRIFSLDSKYRFLGVLKFFEFIKFFRN